MDGLKILGAEVFYANSCISQTTIENNPMNLGSREQSRDMPCRIVEQDANEGIGDPKNEIVDLGSQDSTNAP